jgi:hypothetical protein
MVAVLLASLNVEGVPGSAGQEFLTIVKHGDCPGVLLLRGQGEAGQHDLKDVGCWLARVHLTRHHCASETAARSWPVTVLFGRLRSGVCWQPYQAENSEDTQTPSKKDAPPPTGSRWRKPALSPVESAERAGTNVKKALESGEESPIKSNTSIPPGASASTSWTPSIRRRSRSGDATVCCKERHPTIVATTSILRQLAQILLHAARQYWRKLKLACAADAARRSLRMVAAPPGRRSSSIGEC